MVSSATRMARYVEPHTRYTMTSAIHMRFDSTPNLATPSPLRPPEVMR